MSDHYLNETQQRQIEAWLQEPMARSEWPTWLLIAAIYGAWLALILLSPSLGLLLSAPLLALVSAWHLSLQHELIHGHPTRSTRLNHLLACRRSRCGTRLASTAPRTCCTTATSC